MEQDSVLEQDSGSGLELVLEMGAGWVLETVTGWELEPDEDLAWDSELELGPELAWDEGLEREPAPGWAWDSDWEQELDSV